MHTRVFSLGAICLPVYMLVTKDLYIVLLLQWSLSKEVFFRLLLSL
jgi:hypothetical protein